MLSRSTRVPPLRGRAIATFFSNPLTGFHPPSVLIRCRQWSKRLGVAVKAMCPLAGGSMVPDRESLIRIFSYYRDAEIRGAALLMKMMARERDPEAQVLFSRHIDDETRHAWLWTKRIKDEGALPVEVPDGYQRRLGKALGI